ncbi:MAG: hypothetical protein PUA56_01815 [Bacillales bacterium]|nr:hypothetical protein [Bacillales bacterium]
MRKIIELKKDFKFYYKNNESILVDLPHTWNNIDGADGGDDYYRSTCVYEKEFDKIDILEDEVVYLQFHGVNASARVFLNGKEVIYHNGGYSTFRKEITPLLLDHNVLKILVDNSVNDYVYPQRADFTFYGGIYREVEILICNKKHFDLDYFGGPGFKYITKCHDDDAEVIVEGYLVNSSSVKWTLFDK